MTPHSSMSANNGKLEVLEMRVKEALADPKKRAELKELANQDNRSFFKKLIMAPVDAVKGMWGFTKRHWKWMVPLAGASALGFFPKGSLPDMAGKTINKGASIAWKGVKLPFQGINETVTGPGTMKENFGKWWDGKSAGFWKWYEGYEKSFERGKGNAKILGDVAPALIKGKVKSYGEGIGNFYEALKKRMQ